MYHKDCGGQTKSGRIGGQDYVLCTECKAFVWEDHPAFPLLPPGTNKRLNAAAWIHDERSSPCSGQPDPDAEAIGRRWAALGEAGQRCVLDELERQESARRRESATVYVLQQRPSGTVNPSSQSVSYLRGTDPSQDPEDDS